MTHGLVCGIDIGSTNVKVLLSDVTARTLWVQSIPVPRVMQDRGPVTDAAALVATLERMMVEGWHALGVTVPLQAIAITGVGEDGVPVDGQLRPLDFAIPWFDRRAQQESVWLREMLGSDIRGGMSIDFSRTAAKWRWLRNARSAALESACTWLALTDYPAAWWTGTPFISETLAARTGCYDVFGRGWMPDHLDAAGAPPVPDPLAAGTVVGYVRRGPLTESGVASEATRVVVGGHDHPVAAAAVRRIDVHAQVDSLGTANLMYDEIVSVVPKTDPFIAFSVPALGNAGISCLGVFEFSTSLEGFRAGGQLQNFLAAENAPGQPANGDDIACVLASLSPVGASLRTVLEASCCYARRMLESINAAGSTSSQLYAVGGWARSQALVQLRASVFGRPIATVDELELTALGAALIAIDAIGPGTVSPLARPIRIVHPQPQWQAHYECHYPLVREHLNDLKRAS